jgi:putative ABC transport system permease protein
MILWRRVIGWLGTRRNDAALREELEAHRAYAQDELERSGMTAAEASAESRRRIGNVALAIEDSREVWAVRWMDRARANIRYGLRGLMRERAFGATAVLTLGLGTAAMASVFSVVNAEVWRPLPFQDPRALVSIRSLVPGPRLDNDAVTVDELLEWRQTMPALSAIAAEASTSGRAVRHEFTERILVSEVTANYFTTLGRRALIGRVFNDSDARGSDAALLGSRLWKNSFNSDPGIVGRTLLVDGQPHVVVGVVSTVDVAGAEAGLFLPVDERPGHSTGRLYGAVGRMAPGATAAVVRQEAQAEFDRRALIDRARSGHTADIQDYSAFSARSDNRQLYFFLGAAVFVLALTIVNVAGLVLARGVRRAPEFALRGALGGGTRAIVGQLIAEAALIAVPGVTLGLWLTRVAMTYLGRVIPDNFLWRGPEIPIDYRVLAIVAGVVVVTMAGLALAPLGVARRADAAVAMANGPRSTEPPRSARTRERLLVIQVALTVVLLAGGALFFKSFLALTRVPLGFDAQDGWSMQVSLSGDRYRDDRMVRQYADALRSSAAAIPGVRAVTFGTSSPLMSGWVVMATRPGAPPDAPSTRSIYRSVGPAYFETVGTRITRGRPLQGTDSAGTPGVAVVNEQFVHEFFHDGDPIGRDVTIKGLHSPVKPTTVTVVGVAANIKEVGMNEIAFADIYVPFDQSPATSIELIVRGNGSSESMAGALKAAGARADPAMPVSRVSTIERRVTVALQQDRFNLVLVAGFAAIALLIAAIGVYGAMAYAAVARAREFGVRLALGASPLRLLQSALWRAVRLGVVGGAIGSALTFGFAIWLGDALYLVPGDHNGMLFNVKTTDPFALAGSAAGMIVVALLAGFFPARRLARVDPVTALRAE